MTTVYDVPPGKLVRIVSEKLKKNKAFYLPRWGINVKGMANKELPPQDKDWWWVRCASMIRQIYIHGPVGVSRLRTRYGGRVRRSVKREHARGASGKIIREVLSQLERAGYVAKTKRGRIISPTGKSFLDTTARELEVMEESTNED